MALLFVSTFAILATSLLPSFGSSPPAHRMWFPGGSVAGNRPPSLDRVSIIRRLFERPVRPLPTSRALGHTPFLAPYSSITRIDFPIPGEAPCDGLPNGLAADLNNLGQITYSAICNGNLQLSPGYVIDPDGSHHELSTSVVDPLIGPSLINASEIPDALNDVGGVAGWYSYSWQTSDNYGVFGGNLGWLLQGGVYATSYFDGYVDGAQAVAINNANVAVGYSQDDPKYLMYSALAFSAQQHRRPLLGLSHLPCASGVSQPNTSEALGVNDSGEAVGWESFDCKGASGGSYEAVRFNLHRYAVALFPPISNEYVSAAEAINRNGDIVGYSGYNNRSSSFNGFLFRPACNCIASIPAPSGDGNTETYVLSINASDEVVGFAYGGNTNSSAPIFYKNGVSYDLNTLLPPKTGWTLLTATNINDAGEIIGEGQYVDPLTGITSVGIYAMKP